VVKWVSGLQSNKRRKEELNVRNPFFAWNTKKRGGGGFWIRVQEVKRERRKKMVRLQEVLFLRKERKKNKIIRNVVGRSFVWTAGQDDEEERGKSRGFKINEMQVFFLRRERLSFNSRGRMSKRMENPK
jgi:hypothetical protein